MLFFTIQEARVKQVIKLTCLRSEKTPAALLASLSESVNVMIVSFPAASILFLKCFSKAIQKKTFSHIDSKKNKIILFHGKVYGNNAIKEAPVWQVKTEWVLMAGD